MRERERETRRQALHSASRHRLLASRAPAAAATPTRQRESRSMRVATLSPPLFLSTSIITALSCKKRRPRR